MKKLQFALFSICALSSALLSAQKPDQTYQPYTLAFRLTPAEASAIVRQPKPLLDEAWLHTLADTLFKPEEENQLPAGAYLLVQAKAEELIAELFIANTLKANILNTSRDFAFALVDSLGKDVPDARALLNGKVVPFDPEQKCYRSPKGKRGGLLEIFAGDELLLAEVENIGLTRSKPYWNLYYRALRNKKGLIRQLNKPAALTKACVGIAREKSYIRRNRRAETRNFKGYIAMSQPLYRPGDTLRVKAYLTTGNKGKPWNKPLELGLYENRSNPKIQRTIAPSSPGSFEFTWPINDSLTLDRNIGVSFGYNARAEKRPRQLTAEFRYEDYELSEAKFEAKATQETFRRDEPVRILLSALDANGQPMVEGQYKLILSPGRVNEYFANELYLPDTLWQTNLPLAVAGETEVIVPDNIWPEASLRVSAKVQFTNSAGELQEKTFTFNVDREFVPVVASVKNDSVFIFIKKVSSDIQLPESLIPKESGSGSLEQANFSLLESWHDRDEDTERAITLPYSGPLSSGLKDLELLSNGQSVLRNLLENTPYTSEPRGSVWWEGDTAHLKITNPARVPLRWWVARNKEIIARGVSAEAKWRWQSVASAPTDFTLHYTYTWEAEERSRDLNLTTPPKKLLSIRLEQPELVQPGEQVQVKIKVLDADDRPVKNAQLSAGAYNAQFEYLDSDTYGGVLPYVAPKIRQRPAKTPRRKQRFVLLEADDKQFVAPLNLAWQKRLGVDRLLYYQLRNISEAPLPPAGTARGYYQSLPLDSTAFVYPWSGRLPNLPSQADSFALHRPQFVPYIMQSGKAVPIHLIWCNNQLVWYSGTTDSRPYSFYGNPGYNSLQLRTRDGEFRLDSLWLEKGERLVFSIEKEDIAATNAGQKRVSFSEVGKRGKLRARYQLRSPNPTPYERKTLQQTMLLWRPDGHGNSFQYFWESAESIHIVSEAPSYYLGQNKPQIVGPFPPGSMITNLRQAKYVHSFQFEPGFEYKIEEGRERLYQSNWPPDTLTFSGKVYLHDPSHVALGPQHIFPVSLEKPQLKYSFAGTSKPGTGKFHLGKLPIEIPLLAYALAGDTLLGPFNPLNSTISGIRPGAYRLLLLGQEGQFAERSIFIRANTTFHLDIEQALFRKALQGDPIDSLFHLSWSEAEKRAVLAQNVPFSQSLSAGDARILQGKVTDDTGEELIGASVKVMQNGFFIRGTITNVEGDYRILLEPGTYDMEVSYTGYLTQRIVGIPVLATFGTNQQNFVMASSGNLQAVEIIAYKVPLVEQDNVSVSAYSIDDEVVIKGARANSTNYYIDGIRVNDEIPPVQDIESFVDPAEARNKFSDYAYWQPNLRTDARGEAYFQATFPDNITSWRSYVLGMDRRARAGMARTTTQALLALQAQLSLPRFVIAGDRFEAVGRVRNLREDSATVRTQFVFKGEVLKEKTTHIGQSLVETQSLEVPQNTDSLTLAFKMQGRQTADGEERSIAILPMGILERNGQFLLLEGDTSCSLSFDPARGPVSVSLRQSALPLLLEDVAYLKDYPYGCNEQTASRLLALLAEREIRTALKQPIPHEKPIRECLKRLGNSQLPDGSWGWWGGGSTNAWMTAYVAKAIYKAEKAGFPARTQLEKGMNWLRQNLAALPPAEQRHALFALRECGVNLDCKPFLITPSKGQAQPLAEMRLRQLCGEKIQRDSLMRWIRPSATGGFQAMGSLYGWYDCSAQNTLLAYDLAAEAGWTDLAEGIRRHWLESRSVSSRRNTLETAQILLRLLPKVLDAEGQLTESHLEINGVELVAHLQGVPQVAPQQPLQIRKTGSAPVYLAAWQEWQNPMPQAVDSLFKVETRLEQGGQTVSSLRKREPAELVLTLNARKSAEYLMIEVPIPASCGYGIKTQSGGSESHREYFRDRVAIFCEHLPSGQQVFRIALEPRFSGSFTLNAARAELMYFPVLFGRNEGKRVEVGN